MKSVQKNGSAKQGGDTTPRELGICDEERPDSLPQPVDRLLDLLVDRLVLECCVERTEK